MKLLHPFVDIIPGRPGMRPTTAIMSESQIVPGSAVVRLINTTDQENAYTLRLNCEETYWQDEWFTMISLPPDPTKGENAPPSGKPDVRGPQDHWVKLFVPRGGTRDVLIRFNVPQKAECRAKRYRYHVEVETQIVGPNVGTRRRDRTTILDGTATVQPFYKWSLDITPEEHKVNLFRRHAKYELIVTNEGNDWLYCDLKPGRRKELILETPTTRAAVPPPEPGETITVNTDTEPRTGVQRTFPIHAVSKLKNLRGVVTPLPLPITAVRVDAPTVPHVYDDGTYSGSQAVIAVPTSETGNPPVDRNLTYVPAFPSSVTDFFQHSGSFIRGIFFTVVGSAFAVVLFFIMFENVFHNNVLVEPTTLGVAPNRPMAIRGTWLQGANIYVGTADATGVSSNHNWTLVPSKPKWDNPSEFTIEVPINFDHQVIRVKAQRAVKWFPFLTGIMPSYTSKSVVQVGSVLTNVVVKPPEITHLAEGTVKPGQNISVYGSDLGAQGTVLFNNAGVNAVSWTPTKVVATLPASSLPGQVIVQILPIGTTTPIPAGAVQVPAPPVIPGTVVPGQPGQPGTPAGGGPVPGAQAGGGPPIAPTTIMEPPPAVNIKPIIVPPVRPGPSSYPVAIKPNPVIMPHTTPVIVPRPRPRPVVVVNENPPPVNPGGNSGPSPKQQLRQQIETQKAQIQTERASLDAVILQRNALYQKVQEAQGSVDLHDQKSVDSYNALVAQANAANNTTKDATGKYQIDVDQLNSLIAQFNATR